MYTIHLLNKYIIIINKYLRKQLSSLITEHLCAKPFLKTKKNQICVGINKYNIIYIFRKKS